jgi:hypothetical protein
MATLLDVVLAFSTWVKVGWVLWFAWGAWQFVWYRQERHQAATFRLPRRFNMIDPRTPESVGLRSVAPEPSADQLIPPEPERIVHRFVTPDPFDEVPPLVADATTNSSVPVGMGAPHSS